MTVQWRESAPPFTTVILKDNFSQSIILFTFFIEEESPDVIPKSTASLTSVTPPVASALTSHASMPCLVATSQMTDVCHECLQYQQDISKLCQQLDDKVVYMCVAVVVAVCMTVINRFTV